MKLNGWKRIGIVASVVWAIGAYLYAYNSMNNADSGLAQVEIQTCLDAHNGNEVGDNECLKRGEDYAVKMLPSEREWALFPAFVPVPFGWGLVYLALFLIRWTKRGFVRTSLVSGGSTDTDGDDISKTHDLRPAWSRVQILTSGGVIVLLVWFIYGHIEAKRVIADDEHTIADLTAKQKALDETPSFELQSRCSEAAKQYFIREWTGAAPGMDKDYTSHYNPDLRKCFIAVKTSQIQKSGIVFATKGVFDAVEGKTYGEYVWQSDAVKKYWEVEPIQCNGLTPDGEEVQCHSEREFENLMSKYMDVSDMDIRD